MIYEIEISREAKQDLYGIYKYISDVLLVPMSALNQIERLEKAIYKLDQNPMRFRVYDESRWEDLRFIPVDSYIIFYVVDDENRLVSITRIFYGGQNIMKNSMKINK